jgi:hypothetical protein
MMRLTTRKSESIDMPAKKSRITDEERAKRIAEAARELGTDNDPASFDRAFAKVVKRSEGLMRTYDDGWIDGWKSVCGPDAMVPPPLEKSSPPGFEPYRYGYEQGRAVAGGK